MNSLPPFAANTNLSDHPALESIAAYLDGRLPESERRAMASHLDSCAACYEIYTESLRFQKEENAEAQRGVLPFERRKSWFPSPLFRKIAFRLAALLLIGVGAAAWRQLHLPFEPREVGSFTASLANPAELTGNLVEFDRMRGGEEQALVKHWAVAFQSGATLVDLKVAIEADDSERSRDLADYLRVLFQYIPVPLDQDMKDVLSAVGLFQEEVSPSPSITNIRNARLAAFQSLEKILRTNNGEEMAPHFQLGAWTEAGRLAAYRERAAFFADPKNRRSLRWFQQHPPKEEVESALAKIDEAWPEGSFTSAAKAKLTEQFDKVIEPYNVSLTEE